MTTPDLPTDVLDRLAEWLPANEQRSRPAMSLSTAGETGSPDVRTMLLASYSGEGFVFHTENLTRKVADLMANPHVALGFVIADPVRQLTVQGVATRQDAETAAEAFGTISRNRQIMAWLNTNEFVALDRKKRQARWAEFARDHPEGSIEPPPGWVGYLVTPERLTFWEGSADAGALRTEYARTESQWVSSVLPG